MHVWVSPRLHTHTNCELRFPLLPLTSYIRDCRSAPLSKNVFSVSSKEAGNIPGLCSVKLRHYISFRAGLWELIRRRHIAICCLSIQHFIFLLIFQPLGHYITAECMV
jgi:hypothetical protein